MKDGDVRKSTFVYCDVRKPIENMPFTPTPDDIIFNFAAVHRTPGHPDHAYFETNIRGAENVCAFAAGQVTGHCPAKSLIVHP